jgi:16S rRNA G966 N2-methylase RsmD
VKNHGLRVGSGRFKRSAIPGAKGHRGHQNATTARVKEAAFQLVRNRVDIDADWTFYDLFAGSGQMGIEALSLGAAHATFVELSIDRLNEIQRALIELDIPRESYTLSRTKAAKILPEAFALHGAPCVIWADPPYTYGHEPSNDPAQLIHLYREAARSATGTKPFLIMQVHEKSPVLTPEFLAQASDLEIYRYGSNCLIVLEAK